MTTMNYLDLYGQNHARADLRPARRSGPAHSHRTPVDPTDLTARAQRPTFRFLP